MTDIIRDEKELEFGMARLGRAQDEGHRHTVWWIAFCMATTIRALWAENVRLEAERVSLIKYMDKSEAKLEATIARKDEALRIFSKVVMWPGIKLRDDDPIAYAQYGNPVRMLTAGDARKIEALSPDAGGPING